MRTAQLSIATTMLALPASAFALSHSTSPDPHRAQASLPLHVGAHHVTFGQPVDVTGRVSREQAGETVQLQSARTAHSAWRRLASTRVGRGGRFAFRARLRHSGVLRAVADHADPVAVAARTSGAAAAGTATGQADAVSRVAEIAVAAQVRVSAREHAVLQGQQLAVAGQLLPARANRTVALQGRTTHGWKTLGHARTGGRGGFAVHVSATPGTGRRLRVVFAGDRQNARSTGGAGEMTLFEPTLASWYEDAGTTACGYHAGLGVANRTLPCGTKVQLRRGGRTVTATVDDRGPYVGGRDYDLNQNTAAALGFDGVGTVWASVQ